MENEIINASGLFWFLSSIDGETKLKIIEWFNNLPVEEQKYVNILRHEASDETDYFSEQSRD